MIDEGGPENGEPNQNGSQQSRLVDMTVTEDNPIFLRGRSQDSEVVSIEGDPYVTEMMSQLQNSVQNAIVPRNQSQTIVPRNQSHAIVPRNQPQQLMVHSGEPQHSTRQLVPVERGIVPINSTTQQLILHSGDSQATSQLIPVDIGGGQFNDARFGPTNTELNKSGCIEGGNFTGARLGATNITYNINQGSKKQSKHGKRKKGSRSSREGGRSSKRKKRDEDNPDCYKLSESIWLFKHLQLAKDASIFEGEMRSHTSGKRRLAIKCIPNYTERNIREAKNLTKLVPHSNVVTIIHSDKYDGGPMKCMYIAMERCNTMTYQRYTEIRKAKNVPFNLRVAFEHTRQLIAAIHHIHQNGILHRDLKPNSILFSLCGKHIKIIDFGLSKELVEGRSTTHLSSLKPGVDGYRAPEIYNGLDNMLDDPHVSRRADIFSLALVLYYLWSYGFHPFGFDYNIWIYNIKNGNVPDLSRLRVPLKDLARSLLERMLKFESEERLKIDQVQNDQFLNEDWMSAHLKSLKLLWDGDIKDRTGLNSLTCQLYQSSDLQIDLGIASDWLLQVNTTASLDIGSTMNVTNEPPSGYLVTSKDELERLTSLLETNNLMAWIDISKAGEEPKVLVLLCQPGYPELFGFFLPDPKILASMIRGTVSKHSPKQEQPSKQQQQQDETEVSMIPSELSTPSTEPSPPSSHDQSLDISDLIGTSTSAPTPSDTEEFQTEVREQARPSETTPIATNQNNHGSTTPKQHDEPKATSSINKPKQAATELIPWWIFTGAANLQK